jgi:hypothetical protein
LYKYKLRDIQHLALVHFRATQQFVRSSGRRINVTHHHNCQCPRQVSCNNAGLGYIQPFRSTNSRLTISSHKLNAPKFRPCRLGFMFRPILISASVCQARRQISWRYARSLFLRAEAMCNACSQLRPKLVRTKLFIFLRLTRNLILILSSLASAVCFSHSWPQTSRLYDGRADCILAYFVSVDLVSPCITAQWYTGNTRGYSCSVLKHRI